MKEWINFYSSKILFKINLKEHILWEFKNNKNTTEMPRKFLVFIAKVSLLIAKSKIGFQSFIQAIYYWEMNPDQDPHQTLIKML